MLFRNFIKGGVWSFVYLTLFILWIYYFVTDLKPEHAAFSSCGSKYSRQVEINRQVENYLPLAFNGSQND